MEAVILAVIFQVSLIAEASTGDSCNPYLQHQLVSGCTLIVHSFCGVNGGGVHVFMASAWSLWSKGRLCEDPALVLWHTKETAAYQFNQKWESQRDWMSHGYLFPLLT